MKASTNPWDRLQSWQAIRETSVALEIAQKTERPPVAPVNPAAWHEGRVAWGSKPAMPLPNDFVAMLTAFGRRHKKFTVADLVNHQSTWTYRCTVTYLSRAVRLGILNKAIQTAHANQPQTYSLKEAA